MKYKPLQNKRKQKQTAQLVLAKMISVVSKKYSQRRMCADAKARYQIELRLRRNCRLVD